MLLHSWLKYLKVLGLSRKGGDSFDWFFLAKAHWKLGEKEQARHRFDQAVGWMEKYRPTEPELRRFRAEAAALLKIVDDPKTKPKSK